MDGLAKGGSLLVQWQSAADSGGMGVRHIGRQDTATWQAGPNCHCWFLHSRLTRAQRISVSLLSQEKRLVHNYLFAQSQGLSWCQPEEWFYKLVDIFCNQTVWFISPLVEGFQQVTVNRCVSQTSWWWLLLPCNRSKTSERNTRQKKWKWSPSSSCLLT